MVLVIEMLTGSDNVELSLSMDINQFTHHGTVQLASFPVAKMYYGFASRHAAKFSFNYHAVWIFFLGTAHCNSICL